MKKEKLLLSIVIFLAISLNVLGTNYYVSPSGNDGNNGTSVGTPFRTINKAASVVGPGDIVNIADGTYNENVVLNNSGTLSSYIVFRSTNKWGAKIVGSGGSDGFNIDGNYIEIDGIDLTNPGGHGFNCEFNHHLRILNCHAHNCGNSGITCANQTGDYYYIDGNVCNNNASLSWYSGISIYEPEPMPDDAGMVDGYHIVVRNNICYGNFQNGGPYTDGNGIILDDWNHTQNAGTNYTIGALVENNLTYNNGGAGLKFCWTDNIVIRNNITYKNETDTKNTGTYKGDIYLQNARGCTVVNNIAWADPAIFSTNSAIMDRGGASASVNTPNLLAYNILYMSTDGLSGFDYGDGSSPTLLNNLNGVNPLLVNPGTLASSDFHSQSGSPAIDAGSSNYGATQFDLDGNTRVQGTAIDIGAYEYGGGGSIPVSSVSLNPSTLSLSVGSASQLTATVLPSNASNKAVSWSSSNSSIASVNSSGFVTAVSEGIAIITVTTQDGGKTATCNVSVTVLTGSSYTLLTTQTPASTGNDGPYELGMKFSSTVDGLITKIRYYKANGESGTHTGRIWSGAGTQLTSVGFTGETSSGWQEATLNTPLAINANTTYVVTVTSNSAYGATNNGLQSVISNGPLRSIADGANGVYGSTGAFPTSSYQNSNYFRDVVFMEEETTISVTGVSVSPTTASIENGETVQLTETVVPSNATNKTVSWSSSNTSVATVNSNGLVTAQSVGSAIITVTTQDGAKTATCNISVSSDTGTEDLTIQAEDYCGSSGVTLYGTLVGEWNIGDYTKYCNVDLGSGYSNIEMSLATIQTGYFEIRLGSTSGTLIGTVSFTSTGSWDTYQDFSSTLTGASGVHDVFVVGGGTANFDYMTFTGTVSTIAVTGVTVNPSSADIEPGGTVQLTETVVPSNASNKTVSWSSSNTSVATVNSNGIVTAQSAGSAIITVTTQDGGKTANCNISVTEQEVWNTILFDNFESGFGNYTDGGADCLLYTGSTYAHQGSNAADIQDNSGASSAFALSNPINLSSYTKLKIDFWFYAVSMDNPNEDFWVQYNDGSGWETIASYAQSTDFANNQFYNKEIIIESSNYNFSNNVTLRFICDASGNADDVYIDEIDISVNGSVIPSTYSLSVSNGSGDGDYSEGTIVNIAADAAPSGQIFDTWSGDISYIADINAENTTLTMPAANISVVAEFKPDVVQPPADLAIEAESYCSSQGISSWSTGIGNINNGNYAHYCSVDFSTGYNELIFSYATTISGSISIRIDASNGQEIGVFSYGSTGGWETYNDQAADINSAITGVHELYLYGLSGTLNLDKVTLHYNTLKSVSANDQITLSTRSLAGNEQLITIYPNPVSGSFVNIQSSDETILEIELYNLEGKLLFRNLPYSKKLQLNLDDYKSGFYFINVKTENGIYNKKIILR